MKLTPTTGLLGFGAKSITGLTYSAVPNIWPLGSAGLTFSDLEQLKTFKGGVCVNAFLYQWEKNLLNRANVESNQWESQTEKFKNPYGHAKGCVAVSWNKETWDDNKWKGTIRYEWLYTIGDEVLVTYGLWTSDKHSNTNGNDGNQWKTIYINKRTMKNAWKLWALQSNNMPKNPAFFSFEGKKHWGFNPDLGKICKGDNSECSEGKGQKAKGESKWTWEANEEGANKFSDWTSNWSELGFLTWVQQTNQFDDLVKKKGTWTQR